MGHYTINSAVRHVLAALGLIVVATGVGAQETPPDVWQGYRSTSEIALPFAGIAEYAAVRIEASYVRDTETSVAALTRVVTADEPHITDTTLLDTDMRLMQIETCRRQGLVLCPILSVGGSGSGFIDNGRRLYTCRHVVGDWPLAAGLLNNTPVSRILPPMILRNRLGELVYNSAYSANPLQFDALNDDPRLEEEKILKYRALASRPLPPLNVNYSETLQFLIKASDFVSLATEGDLISPIPLGKHENVAIGDRMYLSGFPVRTDLTPPRFDGTPDKLLVSSVLTARLYTPRLPMVMADGLQRPGGSGGMVTNANGEVIGMSCFADRGTAYAFWLNTEAQRAFWDQLRGSTFTDVLNEPTIAMVSATE